MFLETHVFWILKRGHQNRETRVSKNTRKLIPPTVEDVSVSQWDSRDPRSITGSMEDKRAFNEAKPHIGGNACGMHKRFHNNTQEVTTQG